METATDLAERPLPPLTLVRGTSKPSESTERIAVRFFHEWINFESSVLRACAALDLSGLVPRTHDEDNEFLVGSELGLTGRFMKHVCDAVIKALSVTDYASLKFADYQTVKGPRPNKVPDVIMLALSDEKARLVVELKTFWMLDLSLFAVREGQEALEGIENHLGQLVLYMRKSKIRLAVLSTYKFTLFVRRTGDYRFEISNPIPQEATRPSIRQCFIAMSVFASENPTYLEPEGFNEKQLYCPTAEFYPASFRPSPLRRHTIDPKEGSPGEGIGAKTIMYGHDDGIARFFVNCKDEIMDTTVGSDRKAIYEITWEGQLAIAKCWGPDLFQMFAHEARTYKKLAEKNPNGYSSLATDRHHGIIYCSSIFPTGFILILEKVPGESLVDLWDSLTNTEKAHIRSELRKAVVVLRSIGVVCVDCGKHNVLYDKESGRTTLLDFEAVRLIEPNTHSLDRPELWSIFGPPYSTLNRELGVTDFNVPPPQMLLYISTKGALNQMVRVLSRSLGKQGIRVNAISPGPTGTGNFFKHNTDESVKMLENLSLFQKLGDPEEIAAAVGMLWEKEGAWISGQVIRVNGGAV